MLSENEIKRIYWASRRGMLELDLMLVPFMEDCFRSLSAEKQQHYVALMECEDTEIFQWLLGTDSPQDSDLLGIVNDIKAHARAPKA